MFNYTLFIDQDLSFVTPAPCYDVYYLTCCELAVEWCLEVLVSNGTWGSSSHMMPMIRLTLTSPSVLRVTVMTGELLLKFSVSEIYSSWLFKRLCYCQNLVSVASANSIYWCYKTNMRSILLFFPPTDFLCSRILLLWPNIYFLFVEQIFVSYGRDETEFKNYSPMSKQDAKRRD